MLFRKALRVNLKPSYEAIESRKGMGKCDGNTHEGFSAAVVSDEHDC